MARLVQDLESRPRFAVDNRGNPAEVLLDLDYYLSLLIQADVIDPELWPPQAREGAAWLERIRDIERRCIAAHGAFDWEKLIAAEQDEYDRCAAALDELLSAGQTRPLADVLAELGQDQ